MPRKKFGRNRKNRCRFCTRDGCPRPAYVDYKDIGLLKKLCTNRNKISPGSEAEAHTFNEPPHRPSSALASWHFCPMLVSE